jgi:hypothetical protein
MPKFIMKIIVIPGNYNQGLNWAERNCRTRWNNGSTSVSLSDYIIVTNPDQLHGIRNPHGVFVGTWRERDDIREIIQMLHYQSYIENPALQQIWNSL